MSGKIITRHVFPPIPDRRWDWCAYHDGDDESPHKHGWGKTEAEALADLARLDQERAEYEEAKNDPEWILYEGDTINSSDMRYRMWRVNQEEK